MSDFIFSNQQMEKGKLTKEIHAIYHEDFPEVEEFLGEWGTLAVSRNLYQGFQVFENPEYLCAVIGGPVLFFRDNSFLVQESDTAGTEAVFKRWQEGQMRWDEDLSGPFVVMIINKKNAEILCVTDIMSFIPVYIHQDLKSLMLATHSDALARVSNQQLDMDLVSKVDFILHGVVTYPYTVYQNITQIPPASEHSSKPALLDMNSEPYWLPMEPKKYKTIDKTAKDLRSALVKYVANVTEEMPRIAQFISGGEDSRVLSGLLPSKLERDAFIFLDGMNREGVRAKKAADAYGARFNLFTRAKTHYLEVLPSAADMVGDGAEYVHAHTLKLHKLSKLAEYPAVFGGFYADSVLKGDCIVKPEITGRFPFMPQMKRRNHSRGQPINHSVFTKSVLKEVADRRSRHLEFVERFRGETAEEWFELWPSSMNYAIPNLHVNRRLFRSYEPFMANEIVKISAAAPQKWMLNRRLFQRAAKPFLKQTKWLFHSDGHLPYFPWYLNSFIQFGVWGYQQASTRLGLVKGYQGPWGEWKSILESGEFRDSINEYSDGMDAMKMVFAEKDLNRAFKSKDFTTTQRINLLQTLYSNQKSIEFIEERLIYDEVQLN